MQYDMEIKDVLFLDTETTGIPDRNAKWDEDFADYPHVVQLAWLHGEKMENHIILPEGWTIPDEVVEVHGITNEYAMAHGEPFAAVVDMFIEDCHNAGLICGHNIHFDTSIIKANILRELGREYYDATDVESALFKGKRIDTMRATMKWVDARNQWGRLKFPRLEELYAHCFNGESFPAHDAMEDVKALAKCLPKIVAEGLVELKVKEYPPEPELPLKKGAKESDSSKNAEESHKNTPNLSESDSADKPIAETENSQINAQNEERNKLLEQDDF